jgi:hypothetical protein
MLVPRPWITAEVMTGQEVMAREKWLICQAAMPLSTKPPNTSRRESTLPTMRPTANMPMKAPRPRGIMTSPVVTTG